MITSPPPSADMSLAGPAVASGESAYAVVMTHTRNALTARAVQYKWLVIAAVLLGSVSFASALAWRDPRCLIVLMLLPTAVLIFHALDGMTVQRWRGAVLAAWSADSLQFDILAATLRQVPGLPVPTLDGMLDSLPSGKAGTAPVSIRAVLLRTQAVLDRTAFELLTGRAAGSAIVACAVGAAAFSKQPQWLFHLLALPLLAVLLRAWQWRRMRHARATAVADLSKAGVAEQAGMESVGALDWQGVPAPFRRIWLVS